MEIITVRMTKEQAVAVRNAIWHYENDSGKDDVNTACEVLDQLPSWKVQ